MQNEFSPSNFNEIQLRILTSLTTSQKLKYSEIKPLDIENDIYKYHLKHLLEKGFIQKMDGFYEITRKGIKVTTNISAKGEIQDLFKVSVALYVTRKIDNKDFLLVQKRARHPFMGDMSSISGKMHKGEEITDAAKRKLKEETGLEAEFKFLGVHRKIRLDQENILLEDTLYHVCIAEEPRGSLDEQNKYGENSWIEFEKAIELKKENVDSGEISIEIMKRIHNKNFESFYLTERINVKSY